MSGIQGIIITSLDGRPILHSSFRHPLSNYPLLHIDKLNSHLRNIKSTSTSTNHSTMGYDPSSLGTDQFTGNQNYNQNLLPLLWVEGAPTIQQVNRQLQDEEDERVREDRIDEEEEEEHRDPRLDQSSTSTDKIDSALLQDDARNAWNQQVEDSSNTTASIDPNIWTSSTSTRHPEAEIEGQPEDREATASNINFGSAEEAMSHVNALAEQGAALIHVDEGQLRFLCPVIGEINPLLPLSFLRHLILILHHYLTPNFNSNSSSSLSSLTSSLPTSITNSLPSSSSNGNVSSNSTMGSGSLQPLTEVEIRDHFPLVYHLLEEMLDDGNMLTMEWNQLRDVVVKEGWSEAVKRRMGIASEVVGSPSISSPFSSPIPWRRAQSKSSLNPQSNSYQQSNEIYFDIIEKLELQISSKGKVLSGENWGRIQSRSKLKGFPDLTIKFSKGNQDLIVDPVFHQSVRRKKWWDEGVLSFCPPDGVFLLTEFRVGLNSSNGGDGALKDRMLDSFNFFNEKNQENDLMGLSQNPNRPKNLENFMKPRDFKKVLPLQLKSKLNLNHQSTSSSTTSSKDKDNKKSSFEINVSSSLNSSSQSLKSLIVKFSLGEGSTNVDLSSTSISSNLNFDSNLKSLSGGGGGSTSTSTSQNASTMSTYHFDPIKNTITWEIPKLGNEDGILQLKGSWENSSNSSSRGSSNGSLPSNSVLTTFEIQSHSISGLKIESINLTGESYKMFKGVRNCVEGVVEWRW